MTKCLLLKGLGWRIGDGQKVSIWDDVWVPGNDVLNGQNSTSNSRLLEVADLIDTSTRKWNAELISNNFTETDAERILCIPLSLSSHEDLIIWRDEPTGEYSVRSGHKVLSHVGQTQVHDTYELFYKRL